MRSEPAGAIGRRMQDPAFAAQQWEARYEGRVGAINKWIDTLRDRDGRGWLPHVAPMHGGVDARVLSVLRDPGKATQAESGSGFLCIENDDPTAEFQATAFASAGLGAADVMPWNAYPWFIDAAPSSKQLDAGVEVMLELIGMLPKLRVVLLQDNDAKLAWKRVTARDSGLARRRGLAVIDTYHPSPQALWHPDPQERNRRERHRVDAYRQVVAVLDGAP